MRAKLQDDRFMLAGKAVAILLFVAVTARMPAQTRASQQKRVPATNEATSDSAVSQAPATVLDRVVAIVNGDLILDSDVDEERRLAAFEPYRAPGSEFSREKAIERLINRDLILQQLKLQPEDQVSDADVRKQIDKLRKTIPACKQYRCETKQGWDHFLTDQGFTEASLFARWKQRMEMLQFIEERFRMGIAITPDQIKNYYDKTLLPEYERKGATPPKLSAISNEIQQVLLQQKVTGLLNDWLKSLRAQGGVVVLHPGEEAP